MKKVIVFALASGAAALVIIGGAAAANASSGPSTTPHVPDIAITAVDGAPDLSKVTVGTAVDTGQGPVVEGQDGTTDAEPTLVEVPGAGPSVVEVPGALPDLDKTQPGHAVVVPGTPQVIGDGGTTTARH